MFVVREDRSAFLFDVRLRWKRSADLPERPRPRHVALRGERGDARGFLEARRRRGDPARARPAPLRAAHRAVLPREAALLRHRARLRATTRAYADGMRRVLPAFGIEAVEIARKEARGVAISAARARGARDGHVDGLEDLVPRRRRRSCARRGARRQGAAPRRRKARMTIARKAQAGTIQSSDLMVFVEPAEELVIEIESMVRRQFEHLIRAKIEEVLRSHGVTAGRIRVSDRGALDYAIHAWSRPRRCAPRRSEMEGLWFKEVEQGRRFVIKIAPREPSPARRLRPGGRRDARDRRLGGRLGAGRDVPGDQDRREAAHHGAARPPAPGSRSARAARPHREHPPRRARRDRLATCTSSPAGPP